MKKTTKKGEFSSPFFRKERIIEVAMNPKSFKIQEKSVMNFLKPVIKREKELKNSNLFIDQDIWIYFIDMVVPGFAIDFSSTIYLFIVDLTHKQIFDEAEKTGIKKMYSYLEAFSIIRQAILDGEVEERGKCILVYFNVEGSNSLGRFGAYRDDDGQLGIGVSGVDPDGVCDAGGGACFN